MTDVLLTAKSTGAELAMIRLPDGGFAITRNGEPVARCRWSAHQLDACVEEFIRMAKIPLPRPGSADRAS